MADTTKTRTIERTISCITATYLTQHGQCFLTDQYCSTKADNYVNNEVPRLLDSYSCSRTYLWSPTPCGRSLTAIAVSCTGTSFPPRNQVNIFIDMTDDKPKKKKAGDKPKTKETPDR